MASIDYYDSKTGQKKSLDLGPLASLEDLPQKVGVVGKNGGAQRGKTIYKWRGKTYYEGQLPPEVQRVYDAYSGVGGGVNLPNALPQTTGDALIDEAFKERDAANAANEKRYQQALGGIPQSQKLVDDSFTGIDRTLADRRNVVGGLFRQAMGQLDTAGQTAKNDVNREYADRAAGSDQSLISRGLFNSTIKDSADRRNLEAKDRTLNAIDESVRGQKSGLFTQMAGSEAGLIGDQATSQSNKLGLKLGLQGEKRNIIGSKVDEGPNFGDIANFYAQLEQAKAQKKASSGNLFSSILGGASGGLFGALGKSLFAGI